MAERRDDAYDFLVRKSDLHEIEIRSAPSAAEVKLAAGQVLLAVDSFAFTANNITYAVFGDIMQYWGFFPAPEGFGRVPVWGFATVERSAHTKVGEGERVYGYLPMSTRFVVSADREHSGGFDDVAPHRVPLPPFYNQYLRTAADPGYDADREAEQMVFRPLFATAFLIDDFLDENAFFGARSVIVSSASSKTSMGLAFQLHRRGRCEVIGLTSQKNRAFVEGLGCHHRVVAYEDVRSLPKVATVFVDMAGDGEVSGAVHSHFGDALRYSCQVGGTHWRNLAFGVELPGPAPVLFFAPDRLTKRLADWGPQAFQRRLGEAWITFLPRLDSSMVVERDRGKDAMRRVYLDTLDGRADPAKGYIVSP